MKIIAVWHGSIADAARFANEWGPDALVSLVPDREMTHHGALWGFYRVNSQIHALITAIPRLTYKA